MRIVLLLLAMTSTILAEAQSHFDSTDLHGRWHLVEITLELDASNGLGSKAEASFEKSTAAQSKVKQQIAAGDLAIVTQFNYNGTYSHQLISADPEVQFPSYRESGTWRFDPTTNELIRHATDQEITSLEVTVVKSLEGDDLILEQRYTEREYDGVYEGLVETIHLKRFYETRSNN